MKVYLLALLCLSSECWGQRPLTLEFTEVLPITSQRSSSTLEPSRCDEAGNVYARFAEGTRALVLPITRIAADGTSKTRFDLLKSQGKSDWTVDDYYPGEHGEIYELAQSPDAIFHLVRFSKDGQFESAKEIEGGSDVSLNNIVVLKGDRFLVSGVRHSSASTPTGHTRVAKPLTAILNSDGGIVKELRLKDDPAEKDEHGRANSADDLEDEIALGNVAADEGGNIYVARSAIPLKVYVFSASGEFVRVITIRSPMEKASVGRVRVSGGRLATQFYRPTETGPAITMFRTTDAQTGEWIADYHQVEGFGGSFVCYSGSEFTFLGAAKGVETIFHAAPH